MLVWLCCKPLISERSGISLYHSERAELANDLPVYSARASARPLERWPFTKVSLQSGRLLATVYGRSRFPAPSPERTAAYRGGAPDSGQAAFHHNQPFIPIASALRVPSGTRSSMTRCVVLAEARSRREDGR